VVVRFTSNQISFFEKPLILGYTESPMTVLFNNVTIGLNYQTFEFGRNENNSTEVYLFGVASNILYRYTFALDNDERKVYLIDVKNQTIDEFAGSKYSSLVSIGHYIISCSDCISPGVYLFNHELALDQYYEMGSSTNSTINLAIYESSKYSMTLYVAGKRSIDLIQMQEDTSGDVSFKKTDGVYVMDGSVVVPLDHSISIGAGR
jgi:hypothetical protein